MVSVQDIGQFVAATFIQPEHFLGKEIELAGDALSFRDVAILLSKVLGEKVGFREIPQNQAEKAVGTDFARMFQWLDEKGFGIDVPALERTFGIRMTKFADFLATAE